MSYADWMGSSSEDDVDVNAPFIKNQDTGIKGHLKKRLETTYAGDSRFKLDEDFTIDVNHNMPHAFMDSLSKPEYNAL